MRRVIYRLLWYTHSYVEAFYVSNLYNDDLE